MLIRASVTTLTSLGRKNAYPVPMNRWVRSKFIREPQIVAKLKPAVSGQELLCRSRSS
jgi:hypothetical protein